MGAISFSLDVHIVEHFKKSLPLNTFIETGTFEGDTISKMVPYFDEIYSVEIIDYYYQKCIGRFRDNQKVNLFQGDSPIFLRKIYPQFKDQSCLFWLDAHWCSAEATDAQISQCPLIQEIEAIQSLNENSLILIDDARLFVCPPPKPHIFNEWPRFSKILQALRQLSQNHQLTIYNDVLVYYPEKVSDPFNQFAYENAVDWLQIKHLSDYVEILKSEVISKNQEIINLANIAELREQELKQKDQEIKSLANIADIREKGMIEKEIVLQSLHKLVLQYENNLQEKEQTVNQLSAESLSRFDIINTQSLEISRQTVELDQLKQRISNAEMKWKTLKKVRRLLQEVATRNTHIHNFLEALNNLFKK